MKKTLRPHQQEALDFISKNKKGIVQLPTGSGKTFIQANVIINSLHKAWSFSKAHNTVPIYVVLAPRIMLCDQLYKEVREELYNSNIDVQYLIVNSGHTKDPSDKENPKEQFPESSIEFRKLYSTTSPIIINEVYQSAIKEEVPLIIFSTYDSAERLVDLPIYMVLNDEAHYLVSEEFSGINRVLNTQRNYYFTATLKDTISDKGLGMNNKDLFGPIIYSKSPAELIEAGEILRPRIHLVHADTINVEEEGDDQEVNIEANTIVDSFNEHRIHCNIGAKMLVVTKGSDHLNKLVKHPKMQRLLRIRPALQVFDISSEFKPRINGDVVKRTEFLEKLQNLSDTDEAIIFHINILTEGIDVPGITGILPLTTLKLSRFLQTLGRATRLYKEDRKNLYNKIIKPTDFKEFIKPYAWIIIPFYDENGEDIKNNIMEMVQYLRTFGFNPREDVVIRQARGIAKTENLEMVSRKNERAKPLFDMMINIEHQIESIETANKLNKDIETTFDELKNKSLEEIYKFIETL